MNGHKYFKRAVKNGNYRKIERMINIKNIFDPDINYYKYAVKTNIKTVQVLQNIKNIKKITDDVLFYVINKNNYDMLEYLLKEVKLNPNVLDNNGNSILFSIDDNITLEYFINYGANPNVYNNMDQSLLHTWFKTKSYDECKYLCKKCDMNITDKKQNNILHNLLYEWNLCYTDIQLVSKYIDIDLINHKNTNGDTPFSLFINHGYTRDSRCILDYIINNFKTCDLKQTNIHGENIFFMFKRYYIFNDNVIDQKITLNIIKKLLDHGVNPYHTNKYGKNFIDQCHSYIKEFINEYMAVDIKEPCVD
jgi:hypothetical protein